jgi:hypothetical protein
MYGIIVLPPDNTLHIIPMECIKIGHDITLAIGIKDKITATNILEKIKAKNKIDKQ